MPAACAARAGELAELAARRGRRQVGIAIVDRLEHEVGLLTRELQVVLLLQRGQEALGLGSVLVELRGATTASG